MAGVLSFALGLQSTQFAGAIDAAGGRLLAFLSTAQIVNKVMGAISFGGGLTDLANEAGVTEGKLFQLQEAFTQVGASAENVPAFLKRMQMSLSGVDESGQDTRQMLAQMGLDMGKLGGMDATAQIQAIAGALNELSQEQARYAAQRIFGREGGSAALRIARDMAGFNASFANTKEAAEVIQRTAKAFDAIGDKISGIKAKLKGFWAGVADGFTPVINAAISWVDSFDMTKAGKSVGTFIRGLTQIFKEGKLSELISLSVYTGLVGGVEVAIPYFVGKLSNAILLAILSPKIAALSAQQWVAQRSIPGVIASGGAVQSFESILLKNMAPWVDTFEEAQRNVDSDLKENFKRFSPAISGIIESITASAKKMETELDGGKKPKDPIREIDMIASKMEKRRQTDVTDFEKFGFIFGKGGPSPVADATRQTAANTRQMAIYLKSIQDGIKRLTGQTPEVAMP